MVEIGDIKNSDSLQAWLQYRTREDAVMIAHRAAMRVAPFYWDFIGLASPKGDLADLPVLRSCLISGVAGVWPTPEIRDAATAATAAADAAFAVDAAIIDAASTVTAIAAAAFSAAFATDAAVAADAADAATSAVIAAAEAPAAMWSTVRVDCIALTAGKPLISQPLWHDADSPLDETWQVARQNWADRGPGWRFWINWYEDALAGREPSEKLLTDVAQIDPEDWDKGIDHVNLIIKKIVEKYENSLESPSGIATPDQVLAANGEVIRLQLKTLKLYVDEEIIRLRGPNDISETAMGQIVLLESIAVSVGVIQTAFANGASAGKNALAIVDENLPQVIDDANALTEKDSSSEVSETIVVMGATIDYLTKRGTPGYLATGIAAIDVVRSGLSNWRKHQKPPKK